MENHLQESHPEKLAKSVLLFQGRIERTIAGKYCDDEHFTPYEIKQARENKFDKAGLVTLTEVTPCGDWSIDLLPMAMHDLRQDQASDPKMVFVTTGRFAGWEITGVTQDGSHAKADIEIRFNLTKSGEALARVGYSMEDKDCHFSIPNNSIICSTQIRFTRYDDGWRFEDSTKS
jgi:hypothetical protein